MREKLLREYVRCLISESIAHDRIIDVGGVPCKVEVADTDSKRAKGLMGRKSVPDGTGMLFIYPDPMQLSFWMKNTPSPLDIAFIDENWRIVGISRLMPHDLSSVKSPTANCIAALETPAGWFAKNKIHPGSYVA